MRCANWIRIMWQLSALLIVLGVLGAAAGVSAVAQERTCYALVDVTTTLDEPAGTEWDFWKQIHQVSVADDGSIITNRTIEYGGQELKMQIWPLTGKFMYDYSSKDGTTGHSEVTWSNPPQIWCSDDLEYGLEVSATSSRNVAGAGKFGHTPAQMFNPDMQCEGTDIFGDGMGAGEWSSGYEASDWGRCVNLRPKPGETEWVLWFYLSAGKEVEDFIVKYHYIPATDADTPATSGQEGSTTASGQADTPTSSGQEGATPSSAQGDTPASAGQEGANTAPGQGDALAPPAQPEPASAGQGEPSGAASGLTLEAARRRVVAGELALASVWLRNAVDVANLNFEIRYDATVARPDGEIERGDFLGSAIMRSNGSTDGLVRVGFARATGLAGTGTLVLIPFRAVGEPGSRTPLTLAVTTINAADGSVPAVALIHGEIEIIGPDGALEGDCDGDGVLTEADAVCALEISVGLRPPDATVDMDGSREVTSRDAAIILQMTIEAVK